MNVAETLRARVHDCFAPACDSLVDARQLMCQVHWRRVPRSLQMAVQNARQQQVGGPDHCAAALAARDSLEEE